MLKYKRSRPEMDEEALTRRARKNMLLIAALGIVIILADLLVSVTGQTIPIEQENGKLYMIRPASRRTDRHLPSRAR